MADISEKKRRKPKLNPEPSTEDPKPPRTRREKRSGKDDDKDTGKSGKRTKRHAEEDVELKTENEEEVVIVMPSEAQEKKSGSKRPRKSKPAREVLGLDMESSSTSSSDEESGHQGKKGKSGFSSKKARGLAQSRKWDQEDLEVIVPEEEVSAESDYEGEKPTDSGLLWDLDQLGAMDDSEKVNVDWLTRVLPDELLRKVYYHLDPVDVDATSKVCHRLKDMSNDRSVWKVYLPDWTYVTKDRFNKAVKRSDYAACYNYEMQQREDTRVRIANAEFAEYLADQSEWAKGFMTLLLFNRSIDYLSIISFILGTCFAAARCQEAILWNWRLVLIPFYIPMLQLLLTPLAYDLCRKRYTSANIDDVVSSESLSIWHLSFVHYRSYRGLVYLTNLAIVIFFVMLMIKLNDTYDGMPAGPLIIPWLLLLIAVDLEQIFGWASGVSYSEGRAVDRMFILLSSIFIALTLLFVVFKLDSVITWRWVVVLIPLWAYWAFCLGYPVLALFCAACSSSIRDNIRVLNSSDLDNALIYLGGCMVFIAAPIFTWILLSALNLDGAHRSWPVIFIPIFIIEGLVLLGCGVFDLFGYCDN